MEREVEKDKRERGKIGRINRKRETKERDKMTEIGMKR